MAFVKFASNQTGRFTRIVAGVALFMVGLLLIQGTLGMVVAVVGLVPLFAGIVDVCIFAPLFGAPFSGPRVRALPTRPGNAKLR